MVDGEIEIRPPGRREAGSRRYRLAATSGHTIDQEAATPMTGFKVQPP
jgi:hypothetical protein